MTPFVTILDSIKTLSLQALGKKVKFAIALWDEKGTTSVQITATFEEQLQGYPKRFAFSTGSGPDESTAAEALRVNFLDLITQVKAAEEKILKDAQERCAREGARLDAAAATLTALAPALAETSPPDPEPAS